MARAVKRRRRSPAPADQRARIAAARKLFIDTFDREPRARELVRFADSGEVGLVVGALDGISYRVKGQRLPFFHRFSDRPLLIVTFDGRQICVIRGSYRFTKRGFIG